MHARRLKGSSQNDYTSIWVIKHWLAGLFLVKSNHKLKIKNQSPQWEVVFNLVGLEVISGQISISQSWRKGLSPRSNLLRPQPTGGLTVKQFTFFWKREQASVVSNEGGHWPGVPWTFFEISVLLLHLKNMKNRTMTDKEREDSYLT